MGKTLVANFKNTECCLDSFLKSYLSCLFCHFFLVSAAS